MGCFESVNNDTINEDTFGLIPAGKQKRLCAKTESPSGGSAKCVISFCGQDIQGSSTATLMGTQIWVCVL